jgi:hypothetical protein
VQESQPDSTTRASTSAVSSPSLFFLPKANHSQSSSPPSGYSSTQPLYQWPARSCGANKTKQPSSSPR